MVIQEDDFQGLKSKDWTSEYIINNCPLLDYEMTANDMEIAVRLVEKFILVDWLR